MPDQRMNGDRERWPFNGPRAFVVAAVASLVSVSVAFAADPNALSVGPGDIFASLHFNGEIMGDYYTLGHRRAGLIVDPATGRSISQWATNPVSPGHTDIVFGNPDHWPSLPGAAVETEEWAVKENCAGGRAFVWIDAYRNDYPGTTIRNRFQVQTTRAEIRVGDGPWIDITGGGSCGVSGQPYALNEVTADPYSMRVWGDIFDPNGMSIKRKFFWLHRLTHIPAAPNRCWRKNNESVRPAIKQEEAWWDSLSGWKPGSGDLAASGQPLGDNVQFGRWQMIGKGAGPAWGLSFEGHLATSQYCLQQQWTW